MANIINTNSLRREAWMSDAGWNSAQKVPPREMGSGRALNYHLTNQYGACGVGNMYSFSFLNLANYTAEIAKSQKRITEKEYIHERSGGCGFLSVAFIDTPECKEMFRLLKGYFPILYQSPIRFNVNSGNNFFFCIFDTGERVKPEEYTNPDHDDFDEDHEPGFPNGLEW